jgi:AAA domain (dynein-related subfamily)
MRMSAITAALGQIDEIGAEGDLDANVPDPVSLDLDGVSDPVVLPDGKVVYPPTIHGTPLHELATSLMDAQNPARSRFLRMIGPPGVGKSLLFRAIAYTLWTRRGRRVETRCGAPFYGFVEVQLGPSADEHTLRQEYVPLENGQVKLVDTGFVDALRHGFLVVLDEVNVARDVALISINGALSAGNNFTLYLPSTGETVTAHPSFSCGLSYNAGLVGATDLPEAWYSRFPATIEVTSNWSALVKLGAPEPLVAAAARLDQLRLAGEDGLAWTPQFRELETLHCLTERVGERMAISLFASDLHEREQGGRIQPAEAAAACRMLDEAGYGRLRVGPRSRIPNLHGYPRAVAR